MRGLGGLEFAAGIPGSVGGALYMNAGANLDSISDVVESVTFMSDLGDELILERDQLDFSYRSSPFRDMSGVVVEAFF